MFWEIVIVEIKVVIFVIKGEDVFIFVGENKVSFDEDINIFEVEGVCFLRLEDVFKFSIFYGEWVCCCGWIYCGEWLGVLLLV